MAYDKEPELQKEIQNMLKAESAPAQDAVKDAAEPVHEAPGVLPEVQSEGHQPEMSEMERSARALGWKSKEERSAEGKNNDHFVEADEYVRRQPLFERIDKQKKKIDELENLSKQTLAHLAMVRQETYNQAIRDIELKRTQAVEDADTLEFRKLDAESKRLQQQMHDDPIIKQQQQQNYNVNHEPPEVQDFKSRNAHWLNNSSTENRKMAAAAEFVDKYLYRQAQIDQGLSENDVPVINNHQHLAAVEQEIQRIFPHRFNTVKSDTKSGATQVGKSTASVSRQSSSSDLVAQLTQQQRMLGEQFVKMSKDKKGKPQYSLEQYAKDLKDSGRLGK